MSYFLFFILLSTSFTLFWDVFSALKILYSFCIFVYLISGRLHLFCRHCQFSIFINLIPRIVFYFRQVIIHNKFWFSVTRWLKLISTTKIVISKIIVFYMNIWFSTFIACKYFKIIIIILKISQGQIFFVCVSVIFWLSSLLESI